MKTNQQCSDCSADGVEGGSSRRDFLKLTGMAAVAAPLAGSSLALAGEPDLSKPAETAVKALYENLTDTQKKQLCFGWDHKAEARGTLRTFVSNNWQITSPKILSNYFTKKQQDLVHDIFKGIVNPEWYSKFLKQLKDDTGGKPWGAEQSIAIFGKPGDGKFEFVMTGRHMTLRADGNSEDHVAFGGPIFYGHAADTFNEGPTHKGNVFWEQALRANKVYTLLGEEQKALSLVEKTPAESAVEFRGRAAKFTGIPVAKLDSAQKKELQGALSGLIEPFRVDDQKKAIACLEKQGGLDQCHLTFFKQGDIGNDKVWDNWRLEGPAFVWYFRGSPHVHVWVNVADDPSIPLNAKG
ncbi:MAG: DUF3500 domain-containing protein [Gemmataceae bacterium]|nr:DUF3500 domain-containing protein [Gemmataceae bacterium]